MAEAPHGTAPALLGKDIANPMAMILAGGGAAPLRGRARPRGRDTASRAIYESVLEATATGVRTPDLGGHAATSEFTDEVISRVRTKIDIWASLWRSAARCGQRQPGLGAAVAQVPGGGDEAAPLDVEREDAGEHDRREVDRRAARPRRRPRPSRRRRRRRRCSTRRGSSSPR